MISYPLSCCSFLCILSCRVIGTSIPMSRPTLTLKPAAIGIKVVTTRFNHARYVTNGNILAIHENPGNSNQKLWYEHGGYTNSKPSSSWDLRTPLHRSRWPKRRIGVSNDSSKEYYWCGLWQSSIITWLVKSCCNSFRCSVFILHYNSQQDTWDTLRSTRCSRI